MGKRKKKEKKPEGQGEFSFRPVHGDHHEGMHYSHQVGRQSNSSWQPRKEGI